MTMRTIYKILVSLLALTTASCQQFTQVANTPKIILAIASNDYTVKEGMVCYDIEITFDLLIHQNVGDSNFNLFLKADDYDYAVPITGIRGDNTKTISGNVAIPLEAFNQRADSNPYILQTKSWTLYHLADNGDVINKVNMGCFAYTNLKIANFEVLDYYFAEDVISYTVSMNVTGVLNSSTLKIKYSNGSIDAYSQDIVVSGDKITAVIDIPKSSLYIDYNNYRAESSKFTISLTTDSGTDLAAISDITFSYNRKPVIEMTSVELLRTEDYSEDGSSQNKKSYYTFDFVVDGTLFMSDLYTYYIGNWTNVGKQSSILTSFYDSGYNAGEWWISYDNTASSIDYKQLRATLPNAEIVADKSIVFDTNSSGELSIYLIDSNDVTENTRTSYLDTPICNQR